MRVDFAAFAAATKAVGKPQKVKTFSLGIHHFYLGLIKLQVEPFQYVREHFHALADISSTENDKVIRIAHDPCAEPFLKVVAFPNLIQ